MSLLTNVLTDSRHWKEFVIECNNTNRDYYDEDCNDGIDETKLGNTSNGNNKAISNENGDNDNDNDNEERN